MKYIILVLCMMPITIYTMDNQIITYTIDNQIDLIEGNLNDLPDSSLLKQRYNNLEKHRFIKTPIEKKYILLNDKLKKIYKNGSENAILGANYISLDYNMLTNITSHIEIYKAIHAILFDRTSEEQLNEYELIKKHMQKLRKLYHFRSQHQKKEKCDRTKLKKRKKNNEI